MNTVCDLVPLDQYGEARRGIFQTTTALGWFVRQHRAALVEASALLVVAGRRVVDPQRFDEVVRTVGLEAARGTEPAAA